MAEQRFCTCRTIDLSKPGSTNALDGVTTHFFDGTPCRVVPCSAEEPCDELNDVHVAMFGGCWVQRAVFHGGSGATGRLVDPALERQARELYEGAGHMEGDLPWDVLTEQSRQAWRQQVAERGL